MRRQLLQARSLGASAAAAPSPLLLPLAPVLPLAAAASSDSVLPHCPQRLLYVRVVIVDLYIVVGPSGPGTCGRRGRACDLVARAGAQGGWPEAATSVAPSSAPALSIFEACTQQARTWSTACRSSLTSRPERSRGCRARAWETKGHCEQT